MFLGRFFFILGRERERDFASGVFFVVVYLIIDG